MGYDFMDFASDLSGALSQAEANAKLRDMQDELSMQQSSMESQMRFNQAQSQWDRERALNIALRGTVLF